MPLLDGLWLDVRLGWRQARRNPGLSAAVIATLALTLGANTAVFSVVEAFLLRPLAIRDIDRLVRVRENMAAPGQVPELRSVEGQNYGAWLEGGRRVFADMGAAAGIDATLIDAAAPAGDRRPEHLNAARVSANFFPVLGIRPLLGRGILPEEDRPDGAGGTPAAVALLSYDLWTRRFGADRSILGRQVTIDGVPRTVIGVMPRGLHHPWRSQLWLPLAYRSGAASAGLELYAPARLRPGVTLATARAAMNDLANRLHAADPRPATPRSADLAPLRPEMVHGLDKQLYLLTAGAAFVLLIACLNVANLLFAHGWGRSREAAVALALGASRGRTLRQTLVYSTGLALAGGALAVLLAAWGAKPLVALSPSYALGEFDIEPRLDLPTLAAAAGAAVAAGLLCGLLPAWRLSRTAIAPALKSAARGATAGRSSQRVLGGLVMAEVALALMLVSGAGLVLRSFQQQRQEDRGFDVRDTLTFALSLPAERYPQAAQEVAFVRRTLQRLRELPGVTAAGVTTTDPLFPGTNTTGVSIEGHPASGPTGLDRVHDRAVSSGYLESLRVPLLAGRLLDEHDDATAPPVAVISQSMAQRYWPGGGAKAALAAVGRRLKHGVAGSARPWITVVGVVGSLKETDDEEAPHRDAWYRPYAQVAALESSAPLPLSVPFSPPESSAPSASLPPSAFSASVAAAGRLDDTLTFTLRRREGSGAAAALAPLARAAVQAVDAEQPIYDVMTMEERLAERTTPAELGALLYSSFGLLALALAAIGIYGMLAFVVARRLPEMGVRAALGASPAQLRALVFRFAARLAGGGVLVGAIGALAVNRLMAARLYQVAPTEPAVLAAALGSLAAIAAVACYLPASRAARVDPVRALD